MFFKHLYVTLLAGQKMHYFSTVLNRELYTNISAFDPMPKEEERLCCKQLDQLLRNVSRDDTADSEQSRLSKR